MPLLFRATSEDWKLEISGPIRQLPDLLPSPITSVEVDAADTLPEFGVLDQSPRQLATIQPQEPIAPLFFENTDYDLYFTAESEHVRLRLPSAFRRQHKTGPLSHYAINFRNDVGHFELSVEGGMTPVTIRLEVFPSKLDYRSDYIQMRDEVAGIVRNLVLWVQARTFGFAEPAPENRPTLIEWQALMEDYFDELIKAGRAIAQNPHSSLDTTRHYIPPERARRIDERALDLLLRRKPKRPGDEHPGTGKHLPNRVPETRRRVTYDTPVNRYVKAVLFETVRKLKRVIQTDTTGDEDADRTAEQKFFEAFRPSAQHMLRDLRGLLQEPFLQEAISIAPERPASLVLSRHPHYAALEQAIQKLNGGLEVGNSALRIGRKNIALLYEYWCFLRLVELLREHFDLEQQDIVRVKHLEFAVVLQKGSESTIRLRDRTTGGEVQLIYNRLFNALPTINQKPDNVIQLASEDELYLFDAKYRLSFGPRYRKRYNGSGPRASDINTMHRYRDAIVVSRPQGAGSHERIVKGAVVLFPHTDEETYRQHQFFQSIGKVEIGGLPFLPQASTLVTEKLEEILRSSGFVVSDS